MGPRLVGEGVDTVAMASCDPVSVSDSKKGKYNLIMSHLLNERANMTKKYTHLMTGRLARSCAAVEIWCTPFFYEEPASP